ncbi:IS3 family transposase [Paenochrobactrum gallinarii]|uniref:IS3 family transposase n=1 Tax=Paenochrobactrum gallinarii TaxID=643673 RepID=UPI0016151162
MIRHLERASNRVKSVVVLCLEIDRVYDENRKVYGARKVWHTLRMEGHDKSH